MPALVERHALGAQAAYALIGVWSGALVALPRTRHLPPDQSTRCGAGKCGRVAAARPTARAGGVTAHGDRETAGRPISIADAQIAAICRKLGATLATRNTGDFEDTGIKLLDPWQL